jgi:hypothetical protein
VAEKYLGITVKYIISLYSNVSVGVVPTETLLFAFIYSSSGALFKTRLVRIPRISAQATSVMVT